MSYLETISDKRRQKSEAIRDEYASTKLVAVLSEKIKTLGETSSTLEDRIVRALEAVEEWSKSSEKDSTQTLKLLKDIQDTLKEPKHTPVPTVKVTEKPVDTSRIEKLLQEVVVKLSEQPEPQPVERRPAEEKPIIEPLTHYTAQDLDNAPDGSQYVGFMSMLGNWYIMHHDTEKDTNRYYFGDGDYSDEWDKRYSLEFKPLSEAR